MASIQKVKAGRHTYYRSVGSRGINGKPRPIPLLHLGTADQLLNALLTNTQPQFALRSYQHGDLAVLKAMADRLGLVALIDHHCPTSRRPLSIGTTLVLAALKRAVWPCSKRAWAPGAQRPSVHRLFNIHPETLTSQYFWDQMDAVSGIALETIEAELTRKVVHDCHLHLDTLFYDTSNFFTYLDSGNERCTLAQRGHSKQKRFDLR
jgi:transposase